MGISEAVTSCRFRDLRVCAPDTKSGMAFGSWGFESPLSASIRLCVCRALFFFWGEQRSTWERAPRETPERVLDGVTYSSEMSGEGPSRFHTTHWSLIAALPGRAEDREAERAREALEHLCSAYWRPLYAFARYSGHTADEAQDLTQSFLAGVIESGGLGGADPDRGRFRSYLLGAMKHFLSNERARARARKRGGGRRFVDLDVAEMESRIAAHAGESSVPGEADRAFDRDWARETTAAALRQLRDEWDGRGKADLFEAFRPMLTGEGPARAGLAESLGMSENAVSVAIHRLRQRYAALVREAVARTVADEADIDDEMRYLVGVLRKK